MTQPAIASRSLLKRLLVAYRSQLKGAVFLAALSMFAAVLEVAGITVLVLLGKMTADGKTAYTGSVLWLQYPITLSLSQLVAIGVSTVILRLGLQLWASWVEARLATDYTRQQRNRLFRKFIESSWESKSDVRSADLQNMLTLNVDYAVSVLSSLSGGISALGNVFVLLTSALLLNPVFALGIIVVAVLLSLVLRPLSAWAKRAIHRYHDANILYAREVTQAVMMAREIEVFHVGGEVKKQVEDTVERTCKEQHASVLTQKLLVPLYQNFVMLMGFAALAIAAVSGLLHVEILGIVVLILLRISSYTQALQSVYHHAVGKSVFIDALAEAERKHTVGAYQIGTAEVAQIVDLRFDHVSFAYKPETPVLDDLSFDIKRGETIGVVGASGAGKSTLIKLLLGLHSPQHGQILINGVPLRELSRDSWCRRVAYVPQEPHLISNSVEANIRFYRPEIGLPAIEESARLAYMHDTIAALPKGYQTDLGDQGGELSGGQRQRICIARALVGKPDLLILDEPTSALDAVSEDAIQKTLEALHGKTTTIIIAHRLSMLEHCDRILVLQEGRIEAFDTPERLDATSPFYRKSRQLLGA